MRLYMALFNRARTICLVDIHSLFKHNVASRDVGRKDASNNVRKRYSEPSGVNQKAKNYLYSGHTPAQPAYLHIPLLRPQQLLTPFLMCGGICCREVGSIARIRWPL